MGDSFLGHMPWKTMDQQEQRYDMVREMRSGALSVSEVCRRWHISRKTAYKWQQRYRQERLKGLADRSRRPARMTGRTSAHWLERLRRLRRRHSTWGARKLKHRLGQEFGKGGLPGVATLGRWLKRWGMAAGGQRRKPGPVILRRVVREARHCNDVWTVDFKGWYRTGDGTRVDPLTVRDLYSRYGLRVVLLRNTQVAPARREFAKIFKEYGLPKRIRSDNGIPFGGGGPTGLTRLSAWWVKLGIEVEFTTPGRPCENGAHEQFHRVYKAEVARHPTRYPAGQQRRSNRWLRQYNEERPHEALEMKVPAALYRKSRRMSGPATEPWNYPEAGHAIGQGNGEIAGKPAYWLSSYVPRLFWPVVGGGNSMKRKKAISAQQDMGRENEVFYASSFRLAALAFIHDA